MTRPRVFENVQFDNEIMTMAMQEKETLRSEFIDSGVFVVNERIADAIGSTSNVYSTPLFKPASTLSEAKNYDGVNDNTPTTLDDKIQFGMAIGRMQAWKETEFLRYLRGDTPLENLLDNLIVEYYRQQWLSTILSITKGVLGVAGMESHKTVGGSIVGVDMFSAIADLKQKALGDLASKFGLCVMHSKLYNHLVKQKVIDFAKYTDGDVIKTSEVGNIGGMLVFQNDLLIDTTSGNKYFAYLYGVGAFEGCDKEVPTPFYHDYDAEAKGGVDMIYTKQAKVIHPTGFSLNVANITTQSPTNAELATSANWSLVGSSKNAPFAMISFTD